MTIPLEEAVNEVNGISEKLSSEAIQLDGFSGQLVKSTESQADAVSTTGGAIERIENILQKTTKSTDKGQKELKNIRQSASRSVTAIDTLGTSIKQISDANEKVKTFISFIKDVEKKTKVINSIVFKTQLLSVNASIEARSAGKDGKGFGVVAQEVSKLADVSGEAAEAIEEMISHGNTEIREAIEISDERIREGVDLSERTVKVINEVTDQIKDIDRLFTEFHELVGAQDNALRTVNKSIKNLSKSADANKEKASLLKEQSDRLRKFSGSLTDRVQSIDEFVKGAQKKRAS